MAEASQRTVARTTSTSRKICFVAGRGECKEERIVLTIENLLEFFTLSIEEMYNNGLIFQAGNCILKDGTRAPAIWQYSLEQVKDREGEEWVAGYLYLRKRAKSAQAQHAVAFSSGGKVITSYTTEIKDLSQYGWTQDQVIRKKELLQKTRETNSLKVTIVMKVFSSQDFKPVPVRKESPQDASEMRGEVNLDLKRMLDSGDGADVKVRVPKEVGGKVDKSSYTRKVHKAILMGRSSVFAKMFAKRSQMVEALTGKVVISDLSPKGLDIFLHYIYTGEVLEEWTQVVPEILNAAEKYDCKKLKDFCGRNFLAVVTTGNAIKMHKLAKLHNLPPAVCTEVMEFILKNARTVFTEDVIDGIADIGIGE